MLSGFLPALAQWPVFLAMYSALNSFPFALPAGFYWLSSLSAPDPYLILPALVVATALWQTWATTSPEQRRFLVIIPVLMGFFMLRASAAVSLYWAASNLISLAQHYLSTRRTAVA